MSAQGWSAIRRSARYTSSGQLSVDILPVFDGLHRVVHFGMAVAERVRAHPHHRHVDKFAAVEVPDSAARGLAEIGRPFSGQKHLGTLRQKHISAGDNLLCPPPQFLPRSQYCTLVANQMAVGREPVRMRRGRASISSQPKSRRGAKCSNTRRTTSKSSASSTVQRRAEQSSECAMLPTLNLPEAFR